MSISRGTMINLHESHSSEDFNKHYKEYFSTVYKHILYLVGSHQIAEDITQEAFIRLYKSPPEHENVIAWVTKVANNLAYNHIRDQKVRRNREEIIEERDNGKVISIEDAVIKNSEIRLVRKILNSLEPRDKMCLMLKFSGYKYDEIAEVIGVDKSSVGTILARCQTKFKERYLKEVKP